MAVPTHRSVSSGSDNPATHPDSGLDVSSLADSRLTEIEAARQRWEDETVRSTIARRPERRPEFSTLSGLPVERLYTPLDREDTTYGKELGFPGEYPFTRGIYPTMHRGRLWTMRLFAGFGSAEETNRRFRYLLEQGQTGLSTAFDLPTLYGYDADHPSFAGEFGHCGVGISSLADMELLFEGIPLDQVTTSMTINGPAAIVWAMYIVTAEKRGISADRLGGTLQNDILKEYIAQKEYIFPPGPALRLVTDTLEYAARHLPRWHPISISGYHIREAGATTAPAQMLRFHAQTAGCSLTAQQPQNNVVRTTLQALAAVLGGCQSLHTNALDEALGLPGEGAARLALRTQQILAHESGVGSTVDPLGGSYYLERLTDQVEAGARRYLAQIEQLGGVIAGIESGYFQREIAESAYRYQRQVEEHENVIVGVNEYTDADDAPIEVLRIDPRWEKLHLERLRRVRSERDAKAAASCLTKLRRDAEGTSNLMPAILDCVRAYCTLGEIVDALRSVFGEYREQPVI